MKDEEVGAAIMLDGKFWGVQYSDGHSTSEGWGGIGNANLGHPEFLKKPEGATYKGSHLVDELRKGEIVLIKRTVSFEILD